MAQRTPEKYLEILRRTFSSIDSKGLLSINDIGNKNSKVSLEEILVCAKSHSEGLEVANYKAHFHVYSRLQDLTEVGFPEYTLNELIVTFNYPQKREVEGIIPTQEELLQSSLNSLEVKYGKRKVTKLKKRLGIKEIHYH